MFYISVLVSSLALFLTRFSRFVCWRRRSFACDWLWLRPHGRGFWRRVRAYFPLFGWSLHTFLIDESDEAFRRWVRLEWFRPLFCLGMLLFRMREPLSGVPGTPPPPLCLLFRPRTLSNPTPPISPPPAATFLVNFRYLANFSHPE